MKNFFWNLVQKLFKEEIQLSMKKYHNEMKIEENIKRVKSNYPAGTKIVFQSNEPDELLVAHVVRHEQVRSDFMLVVKNDQGQEFVLPDNAPALWNAEREEALQKLSWDERWNVMSKNYYYIDKKTKMRKESPEYRDRNK